MAYGDMPPLTEDEILQRIKLPEFLLTSEEYMIIKIPPMKNFIFKEFNDETGVHGGRSDSAIYSDIEAILNQNATAVNAGGEEAMRTQNWT